MFIPYGAAIACALLVGVYFAFVLTIRQPLSEHLQMEESQLRVGRWLYPAMVPTMLLSGWLMDRLGSKPLLFAGLLASAAGLAWLGMCRTQRAAILPLLALGLAGGLVIVGTTLLIPGVFFVLPPAATPVAAVSAAGHVAANLDSGPLVQGLMLGRSAALRRTLATPSAALNFGYVFAALGTLLAPVIVTWLRKRKSFRQMMLSAGLLCLVPAALVGFTSTDYFPRTHRYPAASLHDLLTEPRLWMAVAMMVLFLPLERSLSTWATRYLDEMHYEASQIPRWLAGFWIAFVLARLAAASVVAPGFEMWLVFVLVATAASTLGNLVGYYGSAQGGRGILIIGGCFGPILPTLLSVVLVIFPQAPATMLGIVFGLGFLSNAIFQPALVAFARSHSIQATVRIPMVAALLLAAPTLMLTLIWRQVG